MPLRARFVKLPLVSDASAEILGVGRHLRQDVKRPSNVLRRSKRHCAAHKVFSPVLQQRVLIRMLATQHLEDQDAAYISVELRAVSRRARVSQRHDEHVARFCNTVSKGGIAISAHSRSTPMPVRRISLPVAFG